jgi:hypothetical protein
MFDPLGNDDALNPSWSETPKTPNPPSVQAYAGFRSASPPNSPVPPTPDKGPSSGLYGREPQIYGAPDAGLISPRETVSSNGTSFERAEPYLRVKITGLDRNRRDILIKFDAQVRFQSLLIPPFD